MGDLIPEEEEYMRALLRGGSVCFLLSITLLCCTNVLDTPTPVPKDDLDGFRGIPWGTNIEAIEGMVYVETRDDSNVDHIKYNVYKRKKDKLSLGLVKLDAINYWFWQDTLAKVTIEASGGESTFDFLKDVCFQRFGQGKYRKKAGSDKARPQYSYQWVGKNIHIGLSYYSWGGTIIWINAREINDEQYDYLRQKIKEGAEEGF